MNKTKLTELLKSFSGKEMREFGKFVNSPYHNESILLVKLYDIIKGYHPEYEDPSLTKEVLFYALYPSEKFNDKKLRDRISDLLKLAEEYIMVRSIREKPLEEKKLKLKQFSERKLDVHFETTFKEIRKALESSAVRDEDYFLKLYEQVSIHREYYEYRKPIGKRIEFFKEGETEVDQFILYFIIKMLKYYVTMQNQERHLKHKYKYKFLEPVLKYIEENNFDSHPVIMIYYYLIRIRINNEDEGQFFKLKELAFEHLKALVKDDMIVVLAELYNYSHFKFTAGNKSFREEQFEIIKLMLKYKAYPQNNGFMTALHFMNCVSVPLSINKLSWVENFLKESRHLLPPDGSQNAYYVSQCYLYVEKKDYGNALESLAKVTGDDFFYQLHLKNQYCKIYYELNEPEMILSVIDSFRNYLSTNPMIPEHFKVPFGNFIAVLKKLTLARLNDDDFMINKLDREIDEFRKGDLMHSDWLKQKIEELLK